MKRSLTAITLLALVPLAACSGGGSSVPQTTASTASAAASAGRQKQDISGGVPMTLVGGIVATVTGTTATVTLTAVTGTVVRNNKTVNNAAVSFVDATGTTAASATTGWSGTFSVSVPAGAYSVVVNGSAAASVSVSGASLNIGSIAI